MHYRRYNEPPGSEINGDPGHSYKQSLFNSYDAIFAVCDVICMTL